VDDWLIDNFREWYYDDIPHSAIIGEVDLVDCVINHPSIWAEKMTVIRDEDSGLLILRREQKYIWNWVLENPGSVSV
jgi:hypothetical protein